MCRKHKAVEWETWKVILILKVGRALMGVVLTYQFADKPQTSCCVWENGPPLCLLGHNLPFRDNLWVYQILPIQMLCQWPDNWTGHENPQARHLVLVSWGLWTQPCTEFFFWNTVLFLIIFSQASMKGIHAFSEGCTEWWKTHRLPVSASMSWSHTWEVKGRKCILPIKLSGASPPCLIKKSC